MPDKPQRTKQERLAAGALLLAQSKAEAGLNAAVDQGIAHAVSQADKPSRAAIVVGVVAASKVLAEAARGAIVDGRQEARVQAARRLRVESTAVGVTLPDGIEHRRHFSYDEDNANGVTAGQALGAAWAGLALALVYMALRKGTSVPAALARTKPVMRPKIERTAGTETPRAYADEGTSILHDVYGSHPELLLGLGRVWSAILDTHVCPTCAMHDGEVVPWDSSFDGGDEPGSVHVLCRCIPMLVNLADYKALRAA